MHRRHEPRRDVEPGVARPAAPAPHAPPGEASPAFGAPFDNRRSDARVFDPQGPTRNDASVRTVALSPDDEPLRGVCERQAAQHWPGARVLVDMVGQRFRAAVYLPEDGVQPEASAQQSPASPSAREALDELLRALRTQPSLRSS